MDSISVSEQEVIMEVDELKFISASVYPSSAINKEIQWTSSKPECVRVENGSLLALNKGVVAVTVAAEENGSINRVILVQVKEAGESEGTKSMINYDRSGMTVLYADSEASVNKFHPKENVLDGDPLTK